MKITKYPDGISTAPGIRVGVSPYMVDYYVIGGYWTCEETGEGSAILPRNWIAV